MSVCDLNKRKKQTLGILIAMGVVIASFSIIASINIDGVIQVNIPYTFDFIQGDEDWLATCINASLGLSKAVPINATINITYLQIAFMSLIFDTVMTKWNTTELFTWATLSFAKYGESAVYNSSLQHSVTLPGLTYESQDLAGVSDTFKLPRGNGLAYVLVGIGYTNGAFSKNIIGLFAYALGVIPIEDRMVGYDKLVININSISFDKRGFDDYYALNNNETDHADYWPYVVDLEATKEPLSIIDYFGYAQVK